MFWNQNEPMNERVYQFGSIPGIPKKWDPNHESHLCSLQNACSAMRHTAEFHGQQTLGTSHSPPSREKHWYHIAHWHCTIGTIYFSVNHLAGIFTYKRMQSSIIIIGSIPSIHKKETIEETQTNPGGYSWAPSSRCTFKKQGKNPGLGNQFWMRRADDVVGAASIAHTCKNIPFNFRLLCLNLSTPSNSSNHLLIYRWKNQSQECHSEFPHSPRFSPATSDHSQMNQWPTMV